MPHLKQLARQIFHETLAAIDIPATMQRKLRRKGTLLVCGETRIDLRDFEKLRVVAIGKAAHGMVEGLAQGLAPFVRLEGGVSAPTPAGKESALASGPTLPDPTTVADAKRIIAEHSLYGKFPTALRRWLDEGKMPETPKADAAAFRISHFLLLLGMDDLFHPAHHAAEAKGFIACCDNATDDWPVERAAEHLLEQLEALRTMHAGQRVARIADGAVSSPAAGHGIGRSTPPFV